jgi:MinD-like ATPase involved in chromosome partitioning or flagellar assembly
LKNNGANNYKGVIINKCLSPGDGNTAFGNLEKAATHFLKENINYLGYLNFSMDSIYSIQNQRLLSQHNQSSSLSTDLTNLSSNFVKHMQLVNNNH